LPTPHRAGWRNEDRRAHEADKSFEWRGRFGETSHRGCKSWGIRRGETLAHVRQLITMPPRTFRRSGREKPKSPSPRLVHDGIVCTGGIVTKSVKLTFPVEPPSEDPEKLSNSVPGREPRRAIDCAKGRRSTKCLQATHPRRGVRPIRGAAGAGRQEEGSSAFTKPAIDIVDII